MKNHFSVVKFLAIRLLQNFTHVMTAQLSWHVQNLVVITVFEIELERNEICMEFEIQGKCH